MIRGWGYPIRLLECGAGGERKGELLENLRMATAGSICKGIVLSIEKKIEVLDKLQSQSTSQLARENGVGIYCL